MFININETLHYDRGRLKVRMYENSQKQGSYKRILLEEKSTYERVTHT